MVPLILNLNSIEV